MWFNRIAAVVLAAACAVAVGRYLADATGWPAGGLALCIVATVIALVQSLRAAHREPASFVAGAYVAFGMITVVGGAIAGDWTRACIALVLLPIIPCWIVEDTRTRNWVNKIGGHRRTTA
ncbi:hypothetical protein [Prescottella sp. R16]|uniref:hypothetical protein n=1 Tax=Prescottella sp. R16 TaxID=3064529 RepID=UPI00272E3D21|nr:hypothetical protein [Prescottella sp. R16]